MTKNEINVTVAIEKAFEAYRTSNRGNSYEAKESYNFLIYTFREMGYRPDNSPSRGEIEEIREAEGVTVDTVWRLEA